MRDSLCEGLATHFQGDLQNSIHLSDNDEEQDALPFAMESRRQAFASCPFKDYESTRSDGPQILKSA
jgi:hypothetical protein